MKKNENVLITGASSGIGFELAKVFAKNGYDLILTARRKEVLNKMKTDLLAEFGANVHIYSADLSNESDVNQLFNSIKSDKLAINILVNNAGFGNAGYYYLSNWEKEDNMIHLNIIALTLLTKLVLKEMIDRNSGKILNVASTAAFQPGPLMAIYFATKAFVKSFSEALSYELKNTGITVTALCPGATKSEFQKTAELGKVQLFEDSFTATSVQVAEYGYKALMKGKRVAVHGTLNKISVFFVWLLPRSIILLITQKLLTSK